MSLQLLLYWLHWRQDLLISEHEIWWSSLGPDRRIERALHKHRRGVRCLLTWSSKDVCPTRDAHREHFYYRDGRVICGKCEELSTEIVRCG